MRHRLFFGYLRIKQTFIIKCATYFVGERKKDRLRKNEKRRFEFFKNRWKILSGKNCRRRRAKCKDSFFGRVSSSMIRLKIRLSTSVLCKALIGADRSSNSLARLQIGIFLYSILPALRLAFLAIRKSSSKRASANSQGRRPKNKRIRKVCL